MAIKIPNFATPAQVSKMNKGNKISSPQGLRDQKFRDDPIQRNIRRGTPEKNLAIPGFLKKGGKVKKTGSAIVHKGEVVIPKKKVGKKTFSQVSKSIRKTMGHK